MTPTEKWIKEDQPLFDVEPEELIEKLIAEGHEPEKAKKMVDGLVPQKSQAQETMEKVVIEIKQGRDISQSNDGNQDGWWAENKHYDDDAWYYFYFEDGYWIEIPKEIAQLCEQMYKDCCVMWEALKKYKDRGCTCPDEMNDEEGLCSVCANMCKALSQVSDYPEPE